MRRRMMKSKIHRATVTSADLNYVGSISIDPALMERADIREWEQVAVLDIVRHEPSQLHAVRLQRSIETRRAPRAVDAI